jgi:transposase
LYTNPPPDGVVLCLDQMGPVSAKSYPGARVIPVEPGCGCRRAKQEIDYGLRGSGYVFGAFKPYDGEVFTRAYKERSTANMVDFLHEVDGWLKERFGESFTTEKRVFAILDNLAAHRSADMMLFSSTHPHWHFIFQPTYAAYLNLIEPWWKVLRSLALKGKRFETWQDVVGAISAGSSYWNAHRHPFFWGHRRRHRHCSHSHAISH